jgi:hypothetical protein
MKDRPKLHTTTMYSQKESTPSINVIKLKKKKKKNVKAQDQLLYHCEATLTISKTFPLYMLKSTSFPFASWCKDLKPDKTDICNQPAPRK